jgi:uncharacterized membrane protein YbhN (UPF0104 family)
MSGLAMLWWRCLAVFDTPVVLRHALAWYFTGELGKYLPGGVWATLGRGEIASRSGKVSRGTAYATTLLSYLFMCLGAILAFCVIAPFGGGGGIALATVLAALAVVALLVAVASPPALRRMLGFARRLSAGRIDLGVPSFQQIVAMILMTVPTWLLVGLSSVLVSDAFGLHGDTIRIAAAAVAAWVVGFLAVPVPAGAGVREVAFVALSGLPTATAVTVASGARVAAILADALGGVVAFGYIHQRGIRIRRRAAELHSVST